MRRLLLPPDLDGWSDALCPVPPPTALARRRANTTPMSHGLSVDSSSAVTSCPRDWWSEISLHQTKQLRFRAAGENQAVEHLGEKDVIFTTAGGKNTWFNFQVCNACFPIVSVYRLTQAGFKLEVNDMTAQLNLPRSNALDLDLIGRTLWLELWDPRPFVHHGNKMIFPVGCGQSSSSSSGAAPVEGGMVITGSRAGAGTTGKLRTEPIPWTVDEAEVEQDAVQTRVRKGPAQPTEEQIMEHNATHLPFRDWCVPFIEGRAPLWPHSRITQSSAAVPMCQLNDFFLNIPGDTDILTVLNSALLFGRLLCAML